MWMKRRIIAMSFFMLLLLDCKVWLILRNGPPEMNPARGDIVPDALIVHNPMPAALADMQIARPNDGHNVTARKLIVANEIGRAHV